MALVAVAVIMMVMLIANIDGTKFIAYSRNDLIFTKKIVK